LTGTGSSRLHRLLKKMIRTLLNLFAGKPIEARSPRWPAVRKEWLTVHNCCAACQTTTALEVHHIEPFSKHPERELDPTNFITLCEGSRQCHLRIGHSFNWQAVNPHSVEDAAQQAKRIRERIE
jgi:5-methylcytosine-specific restriction endonuclease McrA